MKHTVGVDDGMVDEYSKVLHDMNNTLSESFNDDGRNRIRFQSLTQMLHLDGADSNGPALAKDLGLDTIEHHIEQVKINDDAELCRRLLMQGFRADTDKLRNQIDEGDPKILRLYRGFSRFMLEDLEKNHYTAELSKSKRRKLSSKVAFEMIEVSSYVSSPPGV
jgi:pyoverdine/dityrosine biosynthesis protein Dit1